MVQILFIEGNIGSGKSSSLKYLQKCYSQVKESKKPIFMTEPLEEWQNLPTLEGESVNLLNAFYANIPKYGFCFQTYAFLSRMKLLLEAVRLAEQEGREWVICERSIFTDREIFLESLYENGSVTTEERAVYHSLWDFWIGILQPFFSDVEIHFLYLTCDPEIAQQHMIERNREEETEVGLDYLVKLHQKHDYLYLGGENRLEGLLKTLTGNRELQVRFHVISNNQSIIKLYEELNHLVKEVLMATQDENSFGLVNTKKVWKYWDFFWDTE